MDLKQLSWIFWFWVKRHIIYVVVVIFISIGLVLLIISAHYEGPVFAWLTNFGTKFIGGVIVLIAFSALESRSSYKKGINYNEFGARIRTTKRELKILTTFSYLFSKDEYISQQLPSASLSVAKKEFINKVRLSPN
jgi:hypothetical protein